MGEAIKMGGGGSVSLKNGVKWKYKANEVIKPARVLGSTTGTDLFKQTKITDDVGSSIYSNITEGTVKVINDTKAVALLLYNKNVYLDYYTYNTESGDVENEQIILGASFLNSTGFRWSDIVEEGNGIYTAFFQPSFSSSLGDRTAPSFNVNYIKFKIANDALQVLSSGYVPYKTDFNYYPCANGAFYDSATGTYTLLFLRASSTSSKTAAAYLQEVDKNMQLVGNEYGGVTIYSSSSYISGNNYYKQVITKKICGYYVIFHPKTSVASYNLYFYKNKTQSKALAVGSGSSIAGEVDIIELTSTTFLAVTNPHYSLIPHYGVVGDTITITSGSSKSMTYVDVTSTGVHGACKLFKISDSKALCVMFGSGRTASSYTLLAYSYINISGTTPTADADIKLMQYYGTHGNGMFSYIPITSGEFALLFMVGQINKNLINFFEYDQNRVIYKGYQGTGITETSDSRVHFDFIDDNTFVMATSTEIAVFEEATAGTWKKIGSTTVALNSIARMKVLSGRRILIANSSTTLLYKINDDNTVTQLSSLSSFQWYAFFAELRPDLMLVGLNANCAPTFLNISEDNQMSKGTTVFSPSSSVTSQLAGCYQLTPYKYIFWHNGNPVTFVTFGEDYNTFDVKKPTTTSFNNLMRVSKKKFYSLTAVSSTSYATALTMTLDDDLNFESVTSNTGSISTVGASGNGMPTSNMDSFSVAPYCAFNSYKNTYSLSYFRTLTSFDGTKSKILKYLTLTSSDGEYFMASTINRALLATRPESEIVFKVGKFEQRLVKGGNTHLLVSKATPTKYGTAFAIGGVENDSYPN